MVHSLSQMRRPIGTVLELLVPPVACAVVIALRYTVYIMYMYLYNVHIIIKYTHRYHCIRQPVRILRETS